MAPGRAGAGTAHVRLSYQLPIITNSGLMHGTLSPRTVRPPPVHHLPSPAPTAHGEDIVGTGGRGRGSASRRPALAEGLDDVGGVHWVRSFRAAATEALRNVSPIKKSIAPRMRRTYSSTTILNFVLICCSFSSVIKLSHAAAF